jgi:hypothetical protein
MAIPAAAADGGRALGGRDGLLAGGDQVFDADTQVGEDRPAHAFVGSRQAVQQVIGIRPGYTSSPRAVESGVEDPLGAPGQRRAGNRGQKMMKPSEHSHALPTTRWPNAEFSSTGPPLWSSWHEKPYRRPGVCCNGWFGPTISDVHLSSLGQAYRNWTARHFRLKATQHVVHWLGVELVAYS